MSASVADRIDGEESWESLVGRVADEFLARLERGELPDAEEYAARHPHAAELIRRTLAALNLAGGSLGGTASGEGVPEALGDFRIIREVGRGGMGVVYEAEQLSLHRRVALKVLPFAAVMDPRHLQRFHSEALAAAALDHPNVVKVYGVGQDRGVHFIAMQFIDGRPLSDLIRERRGELTGTLHTTGDTPTPTNPTNTRTPGDAGYFRRVAEWGIQAAEALEHAHALGVVHRDVKPSNLLVDGRAELFVADFGLARVGSDSELTGTGDLLGTPRYMSPEQAAARHGLVDHRSDVYSLGASLYELLALRPAFDGADRTTVLKRIGDSDPTPLRSLDARLPRDLETVVLECLEKDPARRYQTAKELADDLRRFLAHEPIRARRASLVQRARKIARRHPGVTATAAIALVAGLVLGIVGLTVSNRMIREEQAKTQKALDRAERDRAVAQAVPKFLNKLLSQADPRIQADTLRRAGGADGLTPDPTIRVLLDRAAHELTPDKIEIQFPGQPLVQAEILRTIGEAYTGIGAYDRAVAHLERARDMHTGELGPDDPYTLTALHSLARAHLAAGQPQKAAELLVRVRDVRRETLGPKHPDTLASMNDLFRCYFRLGQHAEALKLRDEIVGLRTARLGPRHPDTFESRSQLANSEAAVGRVEEALKHHQEILKLRTQTLVENDPATFDSMNNVADCYAKLGQWDEALDLHQETLELRRKWLGRDHPDTFQSMNNVAVAYTALGRHADAGELHEETMELRLKYLPANHPDTLRSMNALAWILADCPDRALRDPARALVLAKHVVEWEPNISDYWNTLGVAHYRTGDWKTAVMALTESTRLGNGGDATDWFFLAMAHWQLGEKDQARNGYDRALRWLETNNRPDEELCELQAEATELLAVGR